MSSAAARRERLAAMRRELAEKEAGQTSTDADAELAEIERRRKEREAARRKRLGLEPEPETETEPATTTSAASGKAEATEVSNNSATNSPVVPEASAESKPADDFEAFMAAKRAARMAKQQQDSARRQDQLGITSEDLAADAVNVAANPQAEPASSRGGREPGRIESAAERRARRQAELEEKARQRDLEAQKQKEEYEAKLRAEQETKDKAAKLDEIYKSDRLHKDVPFPQYIALGSDLLFDGNGIPRHALLRDHLAQEGRLHLDAAFELIDKAGKVIYDEPNVLELSGPVVVVGDIHGQFYDLMHMMNETGLPPATTYLFLGDYVDRGMFSTEVCFYLYALKICFPRQVYLLRGNHECRSITAHFNFMKECTFKYTMGIYQSFINTFDFLPLAAIIQNEGKRFLCLHGGIGPKLTSLEDIKALNRYREPLEAGVLVDILWADPEDEDACESMSPDEIEDWKMIEFEPNQARGCSYTFGYSAVQNFLHRNNFQALLRGHSVMQKGYKKHFTFENTEAPLVYTIFSAPNYCGKYQNLGAYARVRDDVQTFTFVWTAPPYCLPDFQSCINLSIGRIAETTRNVVSAIIQFLKNDSTEGGDSKGKMVSAVVKQIVLSSEPIHIDPTRQIKYKDNLEAFLAAGKENASSELRPSGIDWNRLSRTISSPSLTMQIQMRDVKTEKANRLRRTGTLTPTQIKAHVVEAQKLEPTANDAQASTSTAKAPAGKLTAMDFAAQVRLWKQEHAEQQAKAAAAKSAAATSTTPAAETPAAASEVPKTAETVQPASTSASGSVVAPAEHSKTVGGDAQGLPADLPDLEPHSHHPHERQTSKKDLGQDRKALKKLLAAEEKRRQDEERLRRQQQKNEERVRRRLAEERLREEEEERKRQEREAKERARQEEEEKRRKEREDRKREKAEKKQREKEAKEEEERRKTMPLRKASKLNILVPAKHEEKPARLPSDKPKPERTNSRTFALLKRTFTPGSGQNPAHTSDFISHPDGHDSLSLLHAELLDAEQACAAAKQECEEAERAALLAEKKFRAAQADVAAKRAAYEQEKERQDEEAKLLRGDSQRSLQSDLSASAEFSLSVDFSTPAGETPTANAPAHHEPVAEFSLSIDYPTPVVATPAADAQHPSSSPRDSQSSSSSEVESAKLHAAEPTNLVEHSEAAKHDFDSESSSSSSSSSSSKASSLNDSTSSLISAASIVSGSLGESLPHPTSTGAAKFAPVSHASAPAEGSSTSDSSYDESDDDDDDDDDSEEGFSPSAEQLLKSAIQRQRQVVQEAQLKFESEARELKEIVAVLRDPHSADDSELLNRLEARLHALTISHPQSKAYYKEQREKLNVILESSASPLKSSFRAGFMSRSLASLDSKDSIKDNNANSGSVSGDVIKPPLEPQASRVLVKNPPLSEFQGKETDKRNAIEATLAAWAAPAGDSGDERGDGKDMRRSYSAKLSGSGLARRPPAATITAPSVEPATLAPPPATEEKRRGIFGRRKERKEKEKEKARQATADPKPDPKHTNSRRWSKLGSMVDNQPPVKK